MQISRLDQRKDPRLSTMTRTVAAMGGHLTLIATFADQEPVVLVASHLKEKENDEKSLIERACVPHLKSEMRGTRPQVRS